MRRNTIRLILSIAVLLALIFLWTGVFHIWAQGDPGVLFKLNKILNNQAQIMNRLNEVMSELRKIKIR